MTYYVICMLEDGVLYRMDCHKCGNICCAGVGVGQTVSKLNSLCLNKGHIDSVIAPIKSIFLVTTFFICADCSIPDLVDRHC